MTLDSRPSPVWQGATGETATSGDAPAASEALIVASSEFERNKRLDGVNFDR
jgi:hypothetical protein